MGSTQSWDAGVLRGELTAVQGFRYTLCKPCLSVDAMSERLRCSRSTSLVDSAADVLLDTAYR